MNICTRWTRDATSNLKLYGYRGVRTNPSKPREKNCYVCPLYLARLTSGGPSKRHHQQSKESSPCRGRTFVQRLRRNHTAGYFLSSSCSDCYPKVSFQAARRECLWLLGTLQKRATFIPQSRPPKATLAHCQWVSFKTDEIFGGLSADGRLTDVGKQGTTNEDAPPTEKKGKSSALVLKH